MKTILKGLCFCIVAIIFACSEKRPDDQLINELKSIEVARGEITLCSSGDAEFGTVTFTQVCSEKVKSDFNLAIALLHSFEYTEAEKVFVRVVDADPQCAMGYWGIAMSNFHPLWAAPNPTELEKGSKIVALGRSIVGSDTSSRESNYLEAVASIFDNWNTIDHRTRVLKFEKASQKIFKKYPDDKEAAIFYALSLGAAADPADKSFQKQKKAGDILNSIFSDKPDHPGAAHYLIHIYDYPELAQLGLEAARKYASLAPASAHAQHMPSHIFTRLGLWREAVQSNLNSVSSAKCYAENSGIKGHWDEELHGLDYLIYSYLQQGDDVKALEQLNYLNTITEVIPTNFKVAHSFAAMPARYALERKDWSAAAKLELHPSQLPWEKFLWEKSNHHFAKLLGAVHIKNEAEANRQLQELESIHQELAKAKENYKANLVLIQIKSGKAWIEMNKGNRVDAIRLMTEAADMEDATAKHPVTPGEIIPARELLGDLLLEAGDPKNARDAYALDLKSHPNRFNGVYGAAVASQRLGDAESAKRFYQQLIDLAQGTNSNRAELVQANSFVKKLQ